MAKQVSFCGSQCFKLFNYIINQLLTFCRSVRCFSYPQSIFVNYLPDQEREAIMVLLRQLSIVSSEKMPNESINVGIPNSFLVPCLKDKVLYFPWRHLKVNITFSPPPPSLLDLSQSENVELFNFMEIKTVHRTHKMIEYLPRAPNISDYYIAKNL